MTALAAFLPLRTPGRAAETCRHILDAQAVYAPDEGRIWSSPLVALGRRLFRTLPEDRFDLGPTTAAGGRFVAVGDVRLDNRDDLAATLGLGGAEAARLSDTGLALLCWERWEERALDRLVGDFALVIWDERLRRLSLARDPLGQRPLHYAVTPGFVAVSSMPKGVLALPEVDRRADTDALLEFLALFPENSSASFYRGVSKVEQGHVVSIADGEVATTRFWNPRRRPEAKGKDYAEGLRDVFERAVAARLRGAEERVAAQLSGGLDSTAVVATAARLLGPRGGRLTAFTAVPMPDSPDAGPGGFADEGAAAAAVARAYGNIEHVLLPGTGASPVERLDRIYFLYDRPYLNLCNGVWGDQIMDAARARRLSVMLHGSLGNLSISYSGLPLLAGLLARGRLIALARLGRALVRSGVPTDTVAAQSLGPFVPRRLWQALRRRRRPHGGLDAITALPPDGLRLAVSRGRARDYDVSFRPHRDGFRDRLEKIAGLDVGNYTKGVLGGWGIDLRDPTADRRVVEWCLSAPLCEFVKGGVTRSLARRAFRGIVPDDILEERRRGYQAADWQEGFARGLDEIRSELARIGKGTAAAELIDAASALGSLDAFRADRPPTEREVARYRLAILRGVSAGHFLRKASGSNR
jgi:asparagine synthase (glutamine-hydrolysing)